MRRVIVRESQFAAVISQIMRRGNLLNLSHWLLCAFFQFLGTLLRAMYSGSRKYLNIYRFF